MASLIFSTLLALKESTSYLKLFIFGAVENDMRAVFFFILFVLIGTSLFSQEESTKPVSISAETFYGSIFEHNPEIQHLITGHPTGFLLSFNNKTYGEKEWERRYNYPDWGFSAAYHHSHNKYLGNALGVYGHINWYFFNRHVMFGVGQGVAYMTNPYDTETNYYNNAYGSHIMSATYVKGGFVWENLWKGLGVQAGATIYHYSNANIKAPNNSTNILVFSVGANYLFDYETFPEYIEKEDPLSRTYTEPITLNIELRSGFNENDVIGSGAKPFTILSLYADKRINYKSTFQSGVDVFFSTFLKEYIRYRAVAYPEDGITGDEDYKRVGVFVGHEWRFNKVAMIAQLGYYVYWPVAFENRLYNRVGLKRYVREDALFASVAVKAHWAKAEAIEFGVGYRF